MVFWLSRDTLVLMPQNVPIVIQYIQWQTTAAYVAVDAS